MSINVDTDAMRKKWEDPDSLHRRDVRELCDEVDQLKQELKKAQAKAGELIFREKFGWKPLLSELEAEEDILQYPEIVKAIAACEEGS